MKKKAKYDSKPLKYIHIYWIGKFQNDDCFKMYAKNKSNIQMSVWLHSYKIIHIYLFDSNVIDIFYMWMFENYNAIYFAYEYCHSE